MRHLRLAILAAAVVTTFGLAETGAQAQVFDGGYYSGWYPYWFGGPAYQSSQVPTPPYFAIHPPIYYGTRVGMPYGNSPITRPPRPVVRERAEPREPDVVAKGEWIDNPFFQEAESRKPGNSNRKRRVSSTADTPPMIENPYLVSNESSHKERGPQD